MEERREKAEALNPALAEFLGPEYIYAFWQNPNVVRGKADAVRDGINCVSLAHLALKELFDYELPPELGCAELYLDHEYFKPVEDPYAMKAGDLVWFGIQDAVKPPEEIDLRYDGSGSPVNWREFPVKHVAVHTGAYRDGIPQLLHATNQGGENGVAIWPMSRFEAFPRYKKLYGITRLAIGA